MPHKFELDAQFSASKIKHLLDSVTPSRVSDPEFLATIEHQIEGYFGKPGFNRALMNGDPSVWLAAASIKKGHVLIFHCFCSWGMPLERVITKLMTLRPPMVVPMTWSKHYIDLFSDICAYSWKPAPLAAHLMSLDHKDKIPAVSLKILLRSAFRKKQLDDILLAMRVHMPEMNTRVEQALGWLLEDMAAQNTRLNKLAIELFTPHIYQASFLQAQGNPELRQVLWGTPLTYDSRIALGQMPVAWAACPLAETLGWLELHDVYNTLIGLSLKLGHSALTARLAEHSDINALIRAALIQERVSATNAMEHLSTDTVQILVQLNYLQPVLETQKWRHLPALPMENTSELNIGTNVDSVV